MSGQGLGAWILVQNLLIGAAFFLALLLVVTFARDRALAGGILSRKEKVLMYVLITSSTAMFVVTCVVGTLRGF